MITVIYYAYNIWAVYFILEFLTKKGIQNTTIKHILFSLTCLPAVVVILIAYAIVVIYASAKFDDGLIYKILNYKPFKRK